MTILVGAGHSVPLLGQHCGDCDPQRARSFCGHQKCWLQSRLPHATLSGAARRYVHNALKDAVTSPMQKIACIHAVMCYEDLHVFFNMVLKLVTAAKGMR